MKYIIANWKSNKNISQVDEWFKTFALQTSQLKDSEIIIAPPFSLLSVVKEKLGKLSLCVQDISPFAAGSYTGAIASQNLAGLKAKYVIVGHSERRRYFKETHLDVAQKIDQALNANMIPIVCVDTEYIKEQAITIKKEQLEKCMVAYEPLSAIGTGNNVALSEVEKAKKVVRQHFGEVKFLYGGSVDENNINEYLLVTDGVLVGGASLDAKQFARLVLAARGQGAAEP